MTYILNVNVFWILCLFTFLLHSYAHEPYNENKHINKKYLLYSVNYGEGFNLRRDVYIRFATLLKKLNDEAKNEFWVLVVPPWYRLYHWFKTKLIEPVPWVEFFDLVSMNRYIPVIELEQYIREIGRDVEKLYVLQSYNEPFDGKWEEKYDEQPCTNQHEFRLSPVGGWEGQLSGRLVQIGYLSCLAFQGHASTLKPLIEEAEESIAFDRGECALHDYFGLKEFWDARRSMRFAKPLLLRAAGFRKAIFNTTDEEDGLILPEDWRDEKPRSSPPRGGPYLAVHLRRRDFVAARGDQVPTVTQAAEQVKKLLLELGLNHVYLTTDAPAQEISELKELLKPYPVVQYSEATTASGEYPPLRHKDGQLAVIDQIIASRARHFIGTYESTFSFRIQEEREIFGFPANSTFNRLCGSNADCEQPSKWQIVY